MKDIYELKLFEEIETITNYGSRDILRVPGGWVITMVNSRFGTSTFFPFNNEFFKFKKEETI